jgi:hypothetical protein
LNCLCRSLHHIKCTINTLNFNEWKGSAVLRQCGGLDADFTRLYLLQLGPKRGQRRCTVRCYLFCPSDRNGFICSLEVFQLDASGSQLKVECCFEYDHTSQSFTRYLVRCEGVTSKMGSISASAYRAAPPLPSMRFQLCEGSSGWNQREFTSSEFLASLNVEVTGVTTLRKAANSSSQGNHVCIVRF